MIRRIYADNFRCLGNFEFQPKQLNLLLGDNGSGKTSLFEVLLCLRNFVISGGPVTVLFANLKKTAWDQRELQSFELEIDGPDGVYSYRLEVRHPATEGAEPYVQAEKVDYSGKALFRYGEGQVQLFDENHEPKSSFPFKPGHSFLPNLDAQNRKLWWFKQFMAGISVFQLNPFAMDGFSQKDANVLETNGSNFASWLRYLSQELPQAKLQCEQRLAEVVPGFERFRFVSMGDRKGLVADFVENGKDSHSLILANLSEGQRILAILYSVLYGLLDRANGVASVVCFDEPENFVPLPEIQPWLQSLRDLVEEHSGQAFVISHHPEVIDYLAADSAFRFDRPTGDLARVREWIPDEIMKPSELLVRGS